MEINNYSVRVILEYLQVLKCQVKIFCQYEAIGLEIIIIITATVKLVCFVYIIHFTTDTEAKFIYLFWVDEH